MNRNTSRYLIGTVTVLKWIIGHIRSAKAVLSITEQTLVYLKRGLKKEVDRRPPSVGDDS